MRSLVGILLALIPSTQVFAKGDIAVARGLVTTVYKRLASVPPARADLESWAKKFSEAKDTAAERKVLLEVAKSATSQDSFYSRTVLNYAEPETNEEAEITNNLTDYTALIVGMVRDGADFREVLTADYLYTPDPNLQLEIPPETGGGRGNGGNNNNNNEGATATVQYSPNDNRAYEVLQFNVTKGSAELAPSLVKVPQSGATGLSVASGIYTTRGYGSVFYNDGTNRSPVSFTLENHLCTTLEEVADTSRADVFVRRDVERVPGGDSAKFRQECVGCHAGLDPMSKAFAFIDWDPENNIVTYGSEPVPKVNRNNDKFPTGAVVSDSKWMNVWTQGKNANFGWDSKTTSGEGINSWAKSIANNKKFPECMTKRVYQTVCFKKELNSRDKSSIKALSKTFVDSKFNMKTLFENTAVECTHNLEI